MARGRTVPSARRQVLAGAVQQVAVYYDEWTEKYLSVFGDAIQAHRPTAQQDLHDYLLAATGLADGQRALDAGCGVCGPAVHFARQRRVQIEALTVSPEQARLAADHAAGSGVGDRIQVRVGDYHHLDQLYPAGAFDLVYFLESLSHSPDPRRVLAGVRQVLRPGGAVYIKDFFVRPTTDGAHRRRVRRVVDKVNRLFAVRTARAEAMFGHLCALGFLPDFVRPPQFQVDNTRWQAFDRTHGFDLFDGGEPFDWSHWLELRFRKP